MNVNEVLANRASEAARRRARPKRRVHPNDDVNLGNRRTMYSLRHAHCAAARAARRCAPAVQRLARNARAKQAAFDRIVKSAALTCRTRPPSRSARNSRARRPARAGIWVRTRRFTAALSARDRRNGCRHGAEHAPAICRPRLRTDSRDTACRSYPPPNKFARLRGHEPLVLRPRSAENPSRASTAGE